MKIFVKRWFIGVDTPEYGVDVLILDLSNENVNDDEIAICIQEQIYGDNIK